MAGTGKESGAKVRTTPEILLRNFPPGVVDLAGRIRKLVRVEAREASETATLGWKTINFRAGGRQFAYLALYVDRVHLGFDKGVLLDDLLGLLQGLGKMAWYVRIASPREIQAPALRNPIRQALRLNALAPPMGRQVTSMHKPQTQRDTP